eukprot:CAMPEP_0197671484 /NCGR_PEP_ID=MMETSP1338-20131121/76785_1 /TAXON_ID=43686 ORGANISM="Pelagodinium beii, Strain RCC1491" /NCGR_SAMPLE_ID=MMETSP1338 /ASSEMBLY_ACC=CAM_ASM_000754 /LENGTH=671 /DNA_ID=CAMNT_0043251399 /DNA_START=44 /DNA_END=2060 /DNA_ORIENTATION=+
MSFLPVKAEASLPLATAPNLVSPRPVLQRSPGSTPALPTAPVVLVQATSPLPHPMSLGSARGPATTPSMGGAPPPVSVRRVTPNQSRTVQRCFSAGCLQQVPATSVQPSPMASPGGASQAARYFSGVIRQQSRGTSTPGFQPDPRVAGSATPGMAQKVMVMSCTDLANMNQGRRVGQQPTLSRMYSASSLQSQPHHGEARCATPSTRPTTPMAGGALSQQPSGGASAVGKLHSQLAKIDRDKKTEDRPSSPSRSKVGSEQDPTPKSASSHGEVTPSTSRQAPKSNQGDSGGTEDADREGETLWEVPYSVRASSPPPISSTGGAVSPGRGRRPRSVDDKSDGRMKPRSESQKRRYQVLYEEHEMRQRKWLAKFEQKQRQEEEELQYNLAATCSPRPFNRDEFKNWYSENMSRKQEKAASQVERQRSEARLKAFQELSECTFAPQADVARGASKASRPPPPSGRCHGGCPPTADRDAKADAQQAMADELVAEQVAQINALRQLEHKEQDQQQNGQREFADQLEKSLEEGRRKLKLFEETPEGREYLSTRAQSYLELNHGMSEEAAMAEARGDLARASEAKLQAQAAHMRQQRANADAQQIQLARLKVAWELIQMQRRYADLLEKSSVPRSMLQGFDGMLVDRITKEAWYLEARKSSKGLLKEGSQPLSSKTAA